MCEKKVKIKNKNPKNHNLTRDIDFNIDWSKLSAKIKLNHFQKNQNQIESRKKKLED